MTDLTPIQTTTLNAFLIALSQQPEPLPPGLQAQLPAIGANLSNRIMDLHGIAASLPSLFQAYDAARKDLQAKQTERSKGVIPAEFTPDDQRDNFELSNTAVQILSASDSVQTAKDNLARQTKAGQSFWQRLFNTSRPT